VKPPAVAGQKMKLNIHAICQNAFLPWILYCGLCAVMSFSFRYNYPTYGTIVWVVCLILVLAIGVVAVVERVQSVTAHPSSYGFLFLSGLLAWIAAMVVGDKIFEDLMQPYYDVMNLNTYTVIDPSVTKGQQIMDGGRVVFTQNAVLDLRRSMGFKNKDTYCVAPISVTVDGQTQPLASYDYWAVGVNCCSGNKNDFKCGEFNEVRAHGGLRLMNDRDRQFYRLAVQQAESFYEIKAVHPLFYYWVRDPDAEANDYSLDGYKYFTIGMFIHFGFSLALVAVVTFCFAKLGYY